MELQLGKFNKKTSRGRRESVLIYYVSVLCNTILTFFGK